MHREAMAEGEGISASTLRSKMEKEGLAAAKEYRAFFGGGLLLTIFDFIGDLWVHVQ